MLSQNNYLSYQTLPNPGQYTFDLQVNVDFNSGKIGLGVPTNVQPTHPFARKAEIPYAYGQTVPSAYHHSQPYAVYPDTMVSSYPAIQQQIQQQYLPNGQNYGSGYAPYQMEPSRSNYRSPNHKGSSAYQTTPDTYGSFSMGIQRSVDAVNCVICNRPISRQQFHDHLEEHKGRKKDYGKSQPKIKQQPSRTNSFQSRNITSMEGDSNPRYPARNSVSLDPKGAPHSRRQAGAKKQYSRQISDTQSRIVYAPRDPSQIIDGGYSQSHSSHTDFNYSKTSGYESQGHNTINFTNNRSKPSSKQTNRGQGSQNQPSISGFNNLSSNGYNQPSTSGYNQASLSSFNPPSINQAYGYEDKRKIDQKTNKTKSSAPLLPSQISKHLQEERLRASRHDTSMNSSKNLGQTKSRRRTNLNNSYESRSGNNTSGIYTHNQTKSRIVRPDRPVRLEDIDQSMINHLKDLSRFSRDSHLGQLNKQLKIGTIDEESSDDDYSLRPNPSVRMWSSQSPAVTVQQRQMDQTRFTGALTRTKLPRNYLAMQSFIQDPMYYSCYRSRHPM